MKAVQHDSPNSHRLGLCSEPQRTTATKESAVSNRRSAVMFYGTVRARRFISASISAISRGAVLMRSSPVSVIT